jgi:hypothetical protein
MKNRTLGGLLVLLATVLAVTSCSGPSNEPNLTHKEVELTVAARLADMATTPEAKEYVALLFPSVPEGDWVERHDDIGASKYVVDRWPSKAPEGFRMARWFSGDFDRHFSAFERPTWVVYDDGSITPLGGALLVEADIDRLNTTGRIDDTDTGEEGFAIYLLDETVLPSEIPILSHVELPQDPVIRVADIISYSRTTHEIELTPEACQRLESQEVPRVFVVAVDRQPIYWGTFWAAWFSRSIDGIVLLKPLSAEQRTIRIDIGYPSEDFFSGEDPRDDPLVSHSLETSGMLR